jgi:hypothetical protein
MEYAPTVLCIWCGEVVDLVNDSFRLIPGSLPGTSDYIHDDSRVPEKDCWSAAMLPMPQLQLSQEGR